jgi:hypothetical protein
MQVVVLLFTCWPILQYAEWATNVILVALCYSMMFLLCFDRTNNRSYELLKDLHWEIKTAMSDFYSCIIFLFNAYFLVFMSMLTYKISNHSSYIDVTSSVTWPRSYYSIVSSTLHSYELYKISNHSFRCVQFSSHPLAFEFQIQIYLRHDQ